jgi:hypothetical protein
MWDKTAQANTEAVTFEVIAFTNDDSILSFAVAATS